MKRQYVIMIHIAIWAGWLFLNNSWAIITWSKQPPLPLGYNNVSLIIVFYAAYLIARQYWKIVENNTGMWVDEDGNIVKRYPLSWHFYVTRWPFFAMICLVLSFICLSWLIDGMFVENRMLPWRHPDFFYYTFSKWLSQSFYICGGNVMAAIEYHVRKERKRRKLLEIKCRQKSKEAKFYEDEVKACLRKLEQDRNRDWS